VCGVIRSDRPELMEIGVSNPTVHPPKWIQNGVSVEDQNTADERIPILLRTPAAVRFVSYEPALGPVDFDPLWLRPTPTTAFLDGRVRVGDLLSLGCVGLDWL